MVSMVTMEKMSYPINLGSPKISKLFITQKLIMVHCGHVIAHMKELREYIQNSTKLKLSWLPVTNKILVWPFLGGLLIVNFNLALSSIFTFSVTGSDVV